MKVFFDDIEPKNIELIEIKKVDDDYKLYVNGKVWSEFINHHLVFHFQYPYIYAEIVVGANEKDPIRYTEDELYTKAHELADVIVKKNRKEEMRFYIGLGISSAALGFAVASAVLPFI